MTKIVPLAAALLLGLACPAAAAKPQTSARANLAPYVSDQDYPEEAIRNNEQGTVQFRLDVGSDGRVSGCTVISSSGSPLLDATTCRLMRERARFEPARNARGKAVPDQVTSRLKWKLPEAEMPSRSEAAFTLWTSCVMGEVAKRVPGPLAAREAIDQSFQGCEVLRALLAPDLALLGPVEDLRKSIIPSIEQRLLEMREALDTDPDTGTGRTL
jgi:TonB family protein